MKKGKIIIIVIITIICGLLGMSIYCIQDLKSMKSKINEDLLKLDELYALNNEPMEQYMAMLDKYDFDKIGIEDLDADEAKNLINLENQVNELGVQIFEINQECITLISEFNTKVDKFPYSIFILFID